LAITLGGPGAIFWMWIVGFLGMSIKLIEVTLSMLYRDTKDPDNPHGGPMWVAEKAFKKSFPEMAYVGKILGVVFSISVIASAITGGNMFQAWSVADITYEYFGLEGWITGALLSLIVGTVIIGGIKRIGAITATIVPLMVCLYLFAGSYILFIHFNEIPNLFRLIIASAFNETQATGAFIGGTAISAFMFGMKRAVFSNEAGQGSSAIAHSAVKTNEPVREGLVAGLEPLIDTLVVCTFTALIILSTGIWNRAPDIMFEQLPNINKQSDHWSFTNTKYIGDSGKVGDPVIMLVEASANKQTGQNIHKIAGIITINQNDLEIEWGSFTSNIPPRIYLEGYFYDYVGATLTAKAFDTVGIGLGKWLITIASWFFAISTIMAWGYYGEQGIIYIFGKKGINSFRLIYCLLIFVSTLGFIETSIDLDNLSGIGLGIIVYANLPICWIFGYQAIKAYKQYVTKNTT